MELTHVRDYMTNEINGVFQEQQNGACPTVEFTDQNGVSVRFVVCHLDINMFNRKSTSSMYQETKVGDKWIRGAQVLTMTINDNFYLTPEGDSVLRDEAFESVPDETKPIEGTDPVEYEQKEQLKKGYINEVDAMVLANNQLFDIIRGNVKKKVSKI
jgi:hypothetical protein